VLRTIFLLKVSKIGRFSQNFVQKMMHKVSAVNFCTPHQPSKTRLAPSCFAFDAEHSVTSIEILVSADFYIRVQKCQNTWFCEFLLRERPLHFWRKFEKSYLRTRFGLRLASRDRYCSTLRFTLRMTVYRYAWKPQNTAGLHKKTAGHIIITAKRWLNLSVVQ